MPEDLELELEPLEQEEEQPKAKESDPDEFEIQVDDDPKYKKENWKTDPAKVITDEKERDTLGRRAEKRIKKLTAASSELARQRDIYLQERDELARQSKLLWDQNQEFQRKIQAGSVTQAKALSDASDKASVVAMQEYRDALTAGDAQKAAEANAKLAQAKVDFARYKVQADEAEEVIKAHKPVQQPVQQPAVQTQHTAGWLSRNAWFDPTGGDELSDHAIRIHRKLESAERMGEYPQGYVGSPAYFKLIDKNMRTKFPQKFGVTQSVDNTPPPSTRTASGSIEAQQANRFTGKVLRFTQSEINTAEMLGLDIRNNKVHAKQYASQLARVNGVEAK